MKSILTSIYEKENSKKLKKFKEFLDSPYFNKDKRQTLLYELFIKKKVINILVIKKNIFLNPLISTSSCRKLLSKHLMLFKEFYSIENTRSGGVLWLNSLLKLDLNKNEIISETTKFKNQIKND